MPIGSNRDVPQGTVVDQLRALGLSPGAVVVVHTAFRAVGPIQGGPAGLIAALELAIGPAGTLVMPSMSDDDDRPFDAATTPCLTMGVVADSFWRLPGVTRSDNVFAFAAKGPLARAITAPQPFSPPHGVDSPVGRIAALGGFVLLLGTGHSSNTTVHLAESLAGVPYHVPKYFTAVRDGAPVRVEYDETDHCCENFDRLDAWLRERKLQTEGLVGHGAARLARGADVTRIAVEHLVRDPFAFLHPRGSGCAECELAWKSVAQTNRF